MNAPLAQALVGAVIGFALGLAAFALLDPTDGVPEAAVPAGAAFAYSFGVPGTLSEAGSDEETTSPYWWLNSGGALLIGTGTGSTMLGAAEEGSRWRAAYDAANPEDTDQGRHPQNLFRLVTRSQWDGVRVAAGFRILADHPSESPNRNESNGLLLMSRYKDGDHLYYAGLRVDGHAVIKKKHGGAYYTMAEKPVYPGRYDREERPNLLPHEAWITLAAETTDEGGAVTIRLFVEEEGRWKELLSATDDGRAYGGTPVISGPGAVGIRTDFMDVEFREFRADPLPRSPTPTSFLSRLLP